MPKVKSKPSPNGKPKRGRRPPLAERLERSLDEVIRYFKGEPNNVRVIRVKLTPMQVILRDLVEARVEAGLTTADVAAASGLSVATITRLEKGRMKNPTVDVLERYAKAVGRELHLSVSAAK